MNVWPGPVAGPSLILAKLLPLRNLKQDHIEIHALASWLLIPVPLANFESTTPASVSELFVSSLEISIPLAATEFEKNFPSFSQYVNAV